MFEKKPGSRTWRHAKCKLHLLENIERKFYINMKIHAIRCIAPHIIHFPWPKLKIYLLEHVSFFPSTCVKKININGYVDWNIMKRRREIFLWNFPPRDIQYNFPRWNSHRHMWVSWNINNIFTRLFVVSVVFYDLLYNIISLRYTRDFCFLKPYNIFVLCL